MKISKLISIVGFCSITLIVGCAKDKNMDDLRREQLQESLSRIDSISGTYSGTAVSNLDSTTLGGIDLKFQASTYVQSTGSVSNQQSVTISGTIGFKSISNAEIPFTSGTYDDETGRFQVTLFNIDGTTKSLSLIGQISGDTWDGKIEVSGETAFGAQLHLTKNAPLSTSSSMESGGIRLKQLNRTRYVFEGEFNNDGKNSVVQMSFSNHSTPSQNFANIFSSTHDETVTINFFKYEASFDATINDKLGSFEGRNGIDHTGVSIRNSSLNCSKFDNGNSDFGWDCEMKTKVKVIKLHLTAKQ
jgi:hypothetical protein